MASTVLLALDADSAGQNAMLRAADLAARRQLDLRVVPLPAGTDPAELVQRDGRARWNERSAMRFPSSAFAWNGCSRRAITRAPRARTGCSTSCGRCSGALPPSALRMELMRLVSGRLALSESLVETVLSGGGERARADRPRRDAGAGRGDRPAGARSGDVAGPGAMSAGALSGSEETERAFLALCIALPEQGQTALEQVDVQTYFTSDLLRRAARHLQAHLREPLREGDEDVSLDADLPLKSLLAKLVVQAGREPPNAGMLQVQRLQLELARIDREIQAARTAGGSLGRAALCAKFAAARTEAGLERGSRARARRARRRWHQRARRAQGGGKARVRPGVRAGAR